MRKKSSLQTLPIVDDEPELAETCARVLGRAGFKCIIANDVPAAISSFDSDHPALVLSDINLPTSDGFEIAKYVRQNSPATPVVLMTAHHATNTAEHATRAGAAGYLRKPFSNSELVSTINSLLPGPRRV
jgi:DNA-binding response OmpR family regulator